MKKKLNQYLIGITGFAILVSIVCLFFNPYSFFILILFCLYLLNNRNRLKSALITIDFVAIVSLPFIILIDHYFAKLSSLSPPETLLISVVIASIILIGPFSIAFQLFIKLIISANHEKDHFNLISSYPNLICKVHYTKTKQYSILGFKGVHCRVSKHCFAKGNIKALNLVGLIGELNEGEEVAGDYLITLWDYENEKIIDADFDVIEIRESDKIEEYDAVISKTVAHFYNEIDRCKPINEIKVRIVGTPSISESTKRLLQERCLKVEYV